MQASATATKYSAAAWIYALLTILASPIIFGAISPAYAANVKNYSASSYVTARVVRPLEILSHKDVRGYTKLQFNNLSGAHIGINDPHVIQDGNAVVIPPTYNDVIIITIEY